MEEGTLFEKHEYRFAWLHKEYNPTYYTDDQKLEMIGTFYGLVKSDDENPESFKRRIEMLMDMMPRER